MYGEHSLPEKGTGEAKTDEGIWNVQEKGQPMKENNALLSIKRAFVDSSTNSSQEYSMELLTEGRFRREGRTWMIEFDETELSGRRDTMTRIVYADEKLWLIRTGSVESQLRLQEQQLYETAFHTPMGCMQVSILPTHVLTRLDSEEGDIDLEYFIRTDAVGLLNHIMVHYELRS